VTSRSLVSRCLQRWQAAERHRLSLPTDSPERVTTDRACDELATLYRLATQMQEAVERYLAARVARSDTEPGDHDWANAEMAVRFWRTEFADLRARALTGLAAASKSLSNAGSLEGGRTA
jgi:hypothetical protein